MYFFFCQPIPEVETIKKGANNVIYVSEVSASILHG